ncbi:amidase signature enzyme [Violaceomyces palustris]|uniref:Amidase signature enzyme n=1 Tax=Violaceomyces palustris TaxID=1673888 RepID=A0ACD0NZ03_9BASI|nr:amidase signature enzyme [Violaceomyces palustris]
MSDPTGDAIPSTTSQAAGPERLGRDVESAVASFGPVTDSDLVHLDESLASFHKRLVGSSLASAGDAPKFSIQAKVESKIRLACQAQLRTNCLTALPWRSALEKARALDEHLLRSLSTSRSEQKDEIMASLHDFVSRQKPLLGLVFSVKDCINVRGFPTTLGCTSNLESEEERTWSLIQTLENLGGIMIARTTCPQAMVSNTTRSPLWGITTSPLGEAFQVGGSSGGEASLVHMGGSDLGIGTDMGGSVRQPACFNQIFGIKFQSSQLPWKHGRDFRTGLPRTEIPATAPGFLARQLCIIETVMKCLSRTDVADDLWRRRGEGEGVGQDQPGCDNLDVERMKEGERLRIAFSDHQACPEISFVIREIHRMLSDVSSRALTRPEEKEKDFIKLPFGAKKWSESWMKLASHVGFTEGLKMVGREAIIPNSMLDPSKRPSTVGEHERDLKEREQLIESLLSTLGDERDLILCPTYSFATPSKSLFNRFQLAEIWCQAINLLDWPCISIPLDLDPKVREDLSTSSKPGHPRFEEWKRNPQRAQDEIVEFLSSSSSLPEDPLEESIPIENRTFCSRHAPSSGEVVDDFQDVETALGLFSSDSDRWPDSSHETASATTLPKISLQIVCRRGMESKMIRLASYLTHISHRIRPPS